MVETWLKPFYNDAFLLGTTNYSLIRNDRTNGRGGGVCIFYKNRLATQIHRLNIKNDSFSNLEFIAFDYFLTKSKFIRFVCIYLPPSHATNPVTVLNIAKLIETLSINTKIYIIGDFNFSGVNWNHISSHFLQLGQPFQIFKTCLDSHNLTQLIKFPTHDHGNTLDLFITSDVQTVAQIQDREPFCDTCDHVMIEITIDLSFRELTSCRPQRNFYRGNYARINQNFNTFNWNEIFTSSENIDLIYQNFISVIHKNITENVPLYRNNKKPRFPKNISRILKLKKLIYKTSKVHNSLKILYKEIDKFYKQQVAHFCNKNEQKILRTTNKKSFFKYINHKLNAKTHLPPLLNSSQDIITDPTEKANLLNDFFCSVYTNDNGIIPNLSTITSPTSLSSTTNINITPETVLASIKQLKPSVARTPDGIPSYFIKQTKFSLAKPLSFFFNLSISQEKVPELWKISYITAVHKKGQRNLPCNNRPIHLTSSPCRLLERNIYDHLLDFSKKHNIISDTQYGFLSKRSTLSLHLDLLNELTTNYDKGLPSEMIYLDFAKAFDSVSHVKLLVLLKHLKIDQHILNWIEHYLTDRRQQTVVDGYSSNTKKVISGVPQGSVLGPFLFNAFLVPLLQTLSTIPNVKTFAFADDLKLLSTDPQSLQKALKLVESWSQNWQLKIQPTKSESISFTTSTQSLTPCASYIINSITIPKTESVKDLGVTLSKDLKWTIQIQQAYSKSLRLINLITRTFKSQDKQFYVKLYQMYIRPILEYNAPVWNPALISEIKLLESVQAKFSKLVCKKLNISFQNYDQRMQILNLESLQARRIKIELQLIYKIINKLIDTNQQNFFSINPCLSSYSLRRHQYYLKPQDNPKTTIRRNFFSHRVIPIWNKLPEEIVTANTLSLFKFKLDKFNLQPFLT